MNEKENKYPECKQMPLHFNGRYLGYCEQEGGTCDECRKIYNERKKNSDYFLDCEGF